MKRLVEDWIQGRGPKLDLIDEVLQRVLADEGLHSGRMIHPFKSTYHEQHPTHTVFFNACIFIRVRKAFLRKWEYQQVWWGDLDLDVDGPALQHAANLRKEPLYVTRERFSWDGLTSKDVKDHRSHDYCNRIRIFKPQTEEDWPGKPDEAY